LYNYFVTPDHSKRPLYAIKGDRAEITPGKNVLLHDSQLYILGGHILGYRDHYINLDPRATGIRFPTPEYRPDKGFGYQWTVGSVIGKSTTIQLHTDAGARELPGYGGIVTHSFLRAAQNGYPDTPRSEFALRFDYGYLENIFVDKPSSEFAYLQRPRNSLSASSQFNSSATGRGIGGEVYSVPSSLQYEVGRKVGDSAFISDLEVEDIDSYRGPYTLRTNWTQSIELPAEKLGRNFYTMTRFDSGVFGSQDLYFWGRGTESLIYDPTRSWTVGGSLYTSLTSGSPDFDLDPLYYHTGAALRADYHLGPRRISAMARYDTRLGIFDYEYIATQAMGALQAFVSYRKYPGDFHIGVSLRVDQFEDLLSRRNWKKSSKITSVGLP
jgi:hypothetical protein